MKTRSTRKRDVGLEPEEKEEEYSYSDRIVDYRKQCLNNSLDFLDKMVDDELKEIKTYKIFEMNYSYENPYKVDETTSINDDVKEITGK